MRNIDYWLETYAVVSEEDTVVSGDLRYYSPHAGYVLFEVDKLAYI